MMKHVDFLVFGGTSEGRKLAEYLNEMQIPACVCVATGYGEELMEEMPYIRVCSGRMEAGKMEEFILQLTPEAVVDATHPYAAAATDNIKTACERTQTTYLRLLRASSDLDKIPGLVTFPDCQSAAIWLNGQKGNIFLTTGMKELPVFAGAVEDHGRIFARVLLQEAIFGEIKRLGLSKKQMICMQGPFTKELNAAMLKQVNASFLVTKESGAAGGFMEKVQAAQEAHAACVVIRRPVAEEGYSLEEVERILTGLLPEKKKPVRKVTLLGIGMGDSENMTVEAWKACEQADCIIGAKRMLKTLEQFQKPMVCMYKSEEIAAYVSEHTEYSRFVIGLSGDVGFYSGAKRLTESLEGVEVSLICGISSVVYFASKLRVPWEDMVLASSHGRRQNVIGAVQANPKVFTLASDARSIRELAKNLADYGLSEIKMSVGADLSYPTETIKTGRVKDFLDYREEGICVALLENGKADCYVAAHGIPDEQFIRGKAPMTKEEVREISVSKLRLTKDAVVYDVGAGTGSVSVECARIAQRGCVYAVEQKGDALALLEENRKKFGVSNLIAVPGSAPEALRELPVPSHVFIGGSGGKLKDIIRCLAEKNSGMRVVINCITLETVCETMELLREIKPEDLDICCVNIAKSKALAGYHMMMGQNPVYIISFQMGESQ